MSEAWGLGDLGTKNPFFQRPSQLFHAFLSSTTGFTALGHLCKNPTCVNIEKAALLGEKSEQNSAERARASQVSPAGLLHSECCHEQQAELTHQDRHLCKNPTCVNIRQNPTCVNIRQNPTCVNIRQHDKKFTPKINNDPSARHCTQT